MGWASATEIFDGAVDACLASVIECGVRVDARVTRKIVERVYDIGWDDWDTQNESCYFKPYLLEIMLRRGEADDEYY